MSWFLLYFKWMNVYILNICCEEPSWILYGSYMTDAQQWIGSDSFLWEEIGKWKGG